mmetsp:Transcript_4945/g.11096  ORF Transcript_4945/g.11096 Transcript_4945/m.11096 type:complete len:265 (-) Transcript_4945:365-1159(-)
MYIVQGEYNYRCHKSIILCITARRLCCCIRISRRLCFLFCCLVLGWSDTAFFFFFIRTCTRTFVVVVVPFLLSFPSIHEPTTSFSLVSSCCCCRLFRSLGFFCGIRLFHFGIFHFTKLLDPSRCIGQCLGGHELHDKFGHPIKHRNLDRVIHSTPFLWIVRMGHDVPVSTRIIKIRFASVIQCPSETRKCRNVFMLDIECQFYEGEAHLHACKDGLLSILMVNDIVILRIQCIGNHLCIMIVIQNTFPNHIRWCMHILYYQTTT